MSVESIILNDLLIQMNRSLLQYVAIAWPWEQNGNQSTHQAVNELVSQQKNDVSKLMNCLLDTGWDVDFGVYPVEYTDLHFVAFDYLLSQLVQNARSVVDDVENALKKTSADAAKSLLSEILQSEKQILAKLEELSSSVKATA